MAKLGKGKKEVANINLDGIEIIKSDELKPGDKITMYRKSFVFVAVEGKRAHFTNAAGKKKPCYANIRPDGNIDILSMRKI